jgi:hypothetical protein
MKAKVLIVIISGENDPIKVIAGLNLAWKTKKNGSFEDVKLFFYGSSEDFIAKTDNPEVLEAYGEVLKNGIVVQGCVGLAKKFDVAAKLADKNIALASSSAVIPDLMAQGYQVLTF